MQERREANEDAVASAKEEAVLGYISARAIPVLAETSAAYVVEGTATLFRHGDRHFLVGADHVLGKLADKTNLGIPASFNGGIVLRHLTGRLVRPGRKWADVGVLELSDTEVKALLDEGWLGIGTQDFARFQQQYPAYLIAGYPSELGRRKEGGVIAAPACCVYSEDHDGPVHHAAEPLHPGVDILMAYPDPDQSAAIPRLNGMSGSAIWTIESSAPQSKRDWQPADEIRVAGIFTSVSPGECMRGKQAQLLIKAFEIIDGAIAEELRTVIHSGLGPT